MSSGFCRISRQGSAAPGGEAAGRGVAWVAGGLGGAARVLARPAGGVVLGGVFTLKKHEKIPRGGGVGEPPFGGRSAQDRGARGRPGFTSPPMRPFSPFR